MAGELVKVPFYYGDVLDATREGDKVLVSLRRCCDNLGINYAKQLKKLKGKEWACVSLRDMQMPGDNQVRSYAMVDLETLPGWLFSIDARNVAEHVRKKLVRYQREAAAVLAKHFLGDVKPPAGFVQIPSEQLDRLVGRLEHLQQQVDRLAEVRASLPTHIPTSATPRTTVQERLRYMHWPEMLDTTKIARKIRALIRRQANIWLMLRYSETPDVSGGPGGACTYYAHQIGVLDEAICYVREAMMKREREREKQTGPHLFSESRPAA